MQTRQDTSVDAQASVVTVPSNHRPDPVVTHTIDEMAQINPAVPVLSYNMFPVLPQGQEGGPSSNAAGSRGCKK